MKKITLKINKPLKKHLPDDTIILDVDRDGVIIDSYWRRRLQDSALDNCVSIVEPKSKTKVPGA